MKEKLLQKVRATTAKLRKREAAPSAVQPPADAQKMTIVPDAPQKIPGEKATLLTQEPKVNGQTDKLLSQLPDSPSGQHGVEFCLPCPSKGDCFLGGQNKLKKISLGNLDEPLPDNADPRAVAAREALINGDIKLGSAGELSYVDPKTGEKHSITGTALRVPGEGIAILVKDTLPIGETTDVGQKLDLSASEKQIPTPEPVTQPAPTISVEIPSRIAVTQTTNAAPVERTVPIQTPPIAESVVTPIVASPKPSDFRPIPELRANTAPIIKTPDHTVASSQIKLGEATKPLPVTTEPVAPQVITRTIITPRLARQTILPGIPEQQRHTPPIVEQKSSAPTKPAEQQEMTIIETNSPQLKVKVKTHIRLSGGDGLPATATPSAETPTTKRKSRRDNHHDVSVKIEENSQSHHINSTTKEPNLTRLREFYTLLRGHPKHQEQQPQRKGEMSRRERTRVRIERSTPAVLSKLMDTITRTMTLDALPSIVLQKKQQKRKTKEVTKHSSEKTVTRRGVKIVEKEKFASTISIEQQKPEKSKLKRKRKAVSVKRTTGENALPKLTKKQVEKTFQARHERKQKKIIEKAITKPQEKQTRPILTDALRARLHARLREKFITPKKELPRPTKESIAEKTRPLMLMIPETTPIEQTAGTIIRIAKEKYTKEKTPGVQIMVSKETYRTLKKVFAKVITQDASSPNTIKIISENKTFSLDIEKLQLLEHEFSNFETQFLLLQLRQCLMQSEIREATVLCGCQSKEATNSFEKISFCQGCHQGYVQQSLFWLTVIFWYLVKQTLLKDEDLSLDQKSSSWYTNQRYE